MVAHVTPVWKIITFASSQDKASSSVKPKTVQKPPSRGTKETAIHQSVSSRWLYMTYGKPLTAVSTGRNHFNAVVKWYPYDTLW